MEIFFLSSFSTFSHCGAGDVVEGREQSEDEAKSSSDFIRTTEEFKFTKYFDLREVRATRNNYAEVINIFFISAENLNWLEM